MGSSSPSPEDQSVSTPHIDAAVKQELADPLFLGRKAQPRKSSRDGRPLGAVLVVGSDLALDHVHQLRPVEI